MLDRGGAALNIWIPNGLQCFLRASDRMHTSCRMFFVVT